MNNNLNEEKKVFAANGIKNTGFYYTKSLIQGKCVVRAILFVLSLSVPIPVWQLWRINRYSVCCQEMS